MSITEELHTGEKIIKEIKPSRLYYFLDYVLGFILLFVFFIGILLIILAELMRRANTYYITNKRIIHEFTFLSRKISSTTYNKIQDIHMTQNIIERIFGIGTIHLNTAGTHFIEIRFKGVKDPISVKRLLETYFMKK